MAAIRGIYNAVMNDNTVTLIISPTQRQSGILFRRMKQFINKNSQMPPEVKIPLAEFIVRETQTVIEFANGSEIHSLPAAEDGSNLRGFTAHMIIMDEAGRINDKVFSTISPMLATTQGALWLIGTPNGQNNYFYKAFSDIVYGFSTYRFSSSKSPLITPVFLEKERSKLPEVDYLQEYEAEFLESVGAMFTKTEVDKCIEDYMYLDKPEKQFEYVLGYDPARFGEDEAVGIIIEMRRDNEKIKPYKVVKIIELKRKSIDFQIKLLRELFEIWHFNHITVDTTGLGSGITDILIEEGIPIESFTFSIRTKQEAYFNTKKLIEVAEVILPRNEKLRKQMLDLRRDDRDKYGKTRADGMIRIYNPDIHARDDYPTALVLALWGVTKHYTPILFDSGKAIF